MNGSSSIKLKNIHSDHNGSLGQNNSTGIVTKIVVLNVIGWEVMKCHRLCTETYNNLCYYINCLTTSVKDEVLESQWKYEDVLHTEL